LTDWTSKSEPTTGWIGEVCEITNPTFQEPLSTGWGYGTDFKQHSSFGYDDTYSAVLYSKDVVPTPGEASLVSDSISVRKGRKYKLTCYFYLWPGASFCPQGQHKINIRKAPGESVIASERLDTLPSDTWNKIEVTFTAPANTVVVDVRFSPDVDSEQPELFCAFDAFKLEEQTTWASSSAPETSWAGEYCNITNPTFAEDISVGWSGHFRRHTSFGYDDSSSAVLYLRDAISEMIGELRSDPIAVHPGRKHRLTCYFYVWPGADFQGAFAVREADSQDIIASKSLTGYALDEWHKIELDFVPSVGSVQIHALMLFTPGIKPDLVCAFDAFSMEECTDWTSASEPTTTWSEG